MASDVHQSQQWQLRDPTKWSLTARDEPNQSSPPKPTKARGLWIGRLDGATSFFLRQTLFLRLINVLDCATQLSATAVAGGAGTRLFYHLCSPPDHVHGAQDTNVVLREGSGKVVWSNSQCHFPRTSSPPLP